MGTRNNPSPGGLRPGLETTNKRTRTRTRKEPVRVSKLATVANASDAVEEVTTMTGPAQTRTEFTNNASTTDLHASASRPEDEQTLTPSVEIADARPIAPLPTRRHNTRSTSRSVSPSLFNPELTDRSQDSKPKGNGRGRSTSASSTHQGVEANNARGPKRSRAASENRDVVNEKPTKRPKSNTTDRLQPATRKRDRRNQIPGSPIPEVPEEDDVLDNKVIKRNRTVQKLPQKEHTFSYAHILTAYPPQSLQQPSQSVEEQVHPSEPPSSHSQLTSFNPSTSTQALAQAEYSQRSDIKSKPLNIAEERAMRVTPTSSTPQQPVIERTDAQSNGRRSNPRDVVQQQSTLHNRSASTPPLPTLKHPQPSVRATATLNGSPILRQGLMDTRVGQASALKSGTHLISDSGKIMANSHELYGKPRSKVRHPGTKAILSLTPMEIYEDSEHEDDSENEDSTKIGQQIEHNKAWKSDLREATRSLHSVLSGESLPKLDSINGTGPKITRRKLGEMPPASRQREKNPSLAIPATATHYIVFQPSNGKGPVILTQVRNIDELIQAARWSQEEGNSVAEAIEFFEASKTRETNRLRSAAPSPASQRANSQTPSMLSFRKNPKTPLEVSDRARSASLCSSDGEAAVHHREMNQAAEDSESVASVDVDDYEGKHDNMSEHQSEVDAKEATPNLPTTPTPKPSQQASEPRAWSSVLTTVKNVVYTPFKFFGRTPNAAEAATTNSGVSEFTFSHPHKPAQPLTTPTRSSKQRVKPQSERRGSTTNERRSSNHARVPQTERQRRHIDRSTPLHLRGVPSARDMQDLHAQQASTRQRQREEEMASSEENELSHGKTFRAPSPSSESDDDGDVTTTSTDDNEDAPASPSPKKEWRFLPQTVQTTQTAQPARKVHFEAESSSVTRNEQKIWSPTKPLTSSQSIQFPTPREMAAASEPKKSAWRSPCLSRGEGADKFEITNTLVGDYAIWERVPSENNNSPFVYVKDKNMRRPGFYRKLHKDDSEYKAYNMFGEEAYWYRFRDGYFVELNHNMEPTIRGATNMSDWREKMKDPIKLAEEKKFLLRKWALVPAWKKPLLLPNIRPYYKRLMEIGEFEPVGSPTGTATASGTSSNILSGTSSAATSSGTYKFPEDDESDNEDDNVETDEADQAQFQTPPPKPRPGNAQLPQSQPTPQSQPAPQPQPAPQVPPTPARAALAAALANANKHRPSAPSNLRNVTQMSPLQQPDQENRDNTLENGSNGTTAKDTRTTMTPGKEAISKAPIKAPDALLQEAAEENMTAEEQNRQYAQVMKDLMNIPDEDIPNIVLPKAMKIQLPFGEDIDYDSMNAATKAAFEMNKENNGGL